MKKTILTLVFVCLAPMIFSQDQFSKNIMIGVYTNIGINQPIRLTSINDDISYYGRGSYTAGVKFSRFLSPRNKLEIGACYSVHKVAFEFSFDPDPDDRKPTETFETFNIPIVLKNYLKNNYFLSVGTIIDIGLPRNSLWTDTQTGFGLSFGGGKDFLIKNTIIDITPNLEIHSLVPFSSVSGQQRLTVLGLRIGINNNCP